MRGSCLPVVAFVLLVAPWPAHAEIDLREENPTSSGECSVLVSGHPDDFEAYRCYLLVARRNQQWSEAVLALEALLRLDPDDHKARLFLGWLEADRFRARADGLLAEAAGGFSREGEARGEVYARLARASFLLRRGEIDEAEAETERSGIVADASGDVELDALTRRQRGWTAYRKGDYSTAAAIFEALGDELLPDGPERLQVEVLGGMASTAWAGGRLADALDLYRRAAELQRDMGDLYAESSTRYNIALVTGRLYIAGQRTLEEVREVSAEAIEAARRGGNLGAEASARLLRAQDPGLAVETRIAEIERTLALTREAGEIRRHCFALRLLANTLLAQDAEGNQARALALIDEAILLSSSVGSLEDTARGFVLRAGTGRATRPKQELIADFGAAIDSVEQLRDLQRDDLVRARFLWDWAFVYYRAAGYLLEPLEQPPTPEDAALAFEIVERLRSRILLDLLDSARATEAASANATGERRQLLDRIAELRRDLEAPGLTESESGAGLAELERLERLEAELGARLAESAPEYGLLREPRIAAIDEVRERLAPDQVMLAFQLSTRETNDRQWYWNGGSWVFRITRDGIRVVPLPDRNVLEEKVAVFLGLLQRRDDLERDAAAGLYEELLGEVLDGLPAGIDKLIVVPDGVLHRLPFGALRSGAATGPLAAEYEISAVPSATLWLHWKRAAAGDRSGSALALADPVLPGVDQPRNEERSAWSVAADGLGPLPHARIEAKQLVREVGGRGRLLVGEKASEQLLKQAELGEYSVLHFATHAVVDDRQPERSAVVLAPGTGEEDGLLHMREMVALELDGAVVILSACSSVSGELTLGEGVVGLARAFFQAGSRAVVGSLWPLRDDEAAALVADLARELGRGSSIGAALAAARRERIRNGAPSAAWAGLVVLGDAEFVPVPGGAAIEKRRWFLYAGGLVLLAALAALLLRRL